MNNDTGTATVSPAAQVGPIGSRRHPCRTTHKIPSTQQQATTTVSQPQCKQTTLVQASTVVLLQIPQHSHVPSCTEPSRCLQPQAPTSRSTTFRRVVKSMRPLTTPWNRVRTGPEQPALTRAPSLLGNARRCDTRGHSLREDAIFGQPVRGGSIPVLMTSAPYFK